MWPSSSCGKHPPPRVRTGATAQELASCCFVTPPALCAGWCSSFNACFVLFLTPPALRAGWCSSCNACFVLSLTHRWLAQAQRGQHLGAGDVRAGAQPLCVLWRCPWREYRQRVARLLSASAAAHVAAPLRSAACSMTLSTTWAALVRWALVRLGLVRASCWATTTTPAWRRSSRQVRRPDIPW